MLIVFQKENSVMALFPFNFFFKGDTNISVVCSATRYDRCNEIKLVSHGFLLKKKGQHCSGHAYLLLNAL